MNMVSDSIIWTLTNLGLAMFGLAVIMIILNKIAAGHFPSLAELTFRWVALLPLGLTGLYAFFMHAFFPDYAAATIGWQNSPFQVEVAAANLGFGLLGILSFRARYGFRLATVISTTCWLWGDAIGHINQMIHYHNFTVGNAGSWFWMDVIIPVVLIISLWQIRKSKLAHK